MSILKVNGANGEELTFAEMAHQIANTAASLAELGVKQGDVIAIISENRSEVVISSLAALCSGATITFINSAYTKGTEK